MCVFVWLNYIKNFKFIFHLILFFFATNTFKANGFLCLFQWLAFDFGPVWFCISGIFRAALLMCADGVKHLEALLFFFSNKIENWMVLVLLLLIKITTWFYGCLNMTITSFYTVSQRPVFYSNRFHLQCDQFQMYEQYTVEVQINVEVFEMKNEEFEFLREELI